MRPRRSRRRLKAAVAAAHTSRAKALANYRLGLFHDNNSREKDAVSHYERALRYGLPARLRAEALAWLASSLCKTARPRAALRRIRQSRNLARDAALRRFLDSLERRVIWSLNRRA